MLVLSLASISGLGIGIAMSWGVGHRHASDLALLGLWCRPAATAPFGPLAWEPPYAGAALRSKTQAALAKTELRSCESLLLRMILSAVETTGKEAPRHMGGVISVAGQARPGRGCRPRSNEPEVWVTHPPAEPRKVASALRVLP